MRFQKLSILPHGRSLQFLGGRGLIKAKLLEEKYEAKREFPGSEGVQNVKPSVGGVWIFLELNNSSQKNMISIYSMYSFSRIVPKEHALNVSNPLAGYKGHNIIR